jgi:hypothetical protein
MRARSAVVSLVLIALCVIASGCGRSSSRERPAPLPPREAARVLVDRNWLDHMPETEKERLYVFRFTPSMGGGVFQDRTLYAGHFELFRFRVEGDVIAFDLPHEGQKLKTRYRIRRVDGPAPFDLALELENSPRGPKRYYGMSREGAAEADVSALLARHVTGASAASR